MTGRSSIAWRSADGVEAIEPPPAEIETLDGEIRAVIVDGRRVPVRVAVDGDAIHVWCAGEV
ncbi:MAG TPA: hypothetical protein VFL12_07575, partial [Thermoanaerobaculia bacterium]|nr:hypothetical protein [Thermoanaerobaculia bacterium]